MRYLLDTDIIIYWLKGNTKIENRAIHAGIDTIAFSIISKAELYFGAYNSTNVEQNLTNVEKLSETLSLVHFNESASQTFGKIKAELTRDGNIILDADIMISSIALTNNLTLVTNNVVHFERIPGLLIENWATT